MGQTGHEARTYVVFSQDGVGKTSLTEAVLYTSKAIRKLGSVTTKDAVTDYDEETIKRLYTTHSAMTHGTWGTTDFNFIDTPGFSNLLTDTRICLDIADAGIFVTDAAHEPDFFSNILIQHTKNNSLPCAIFINKMDGEKALFDQAIENIKSKLNVTPVVLSYPMGAAESFSGVVNLIDMKAYTYADDSGKAKTQELSAELKDSIAAIRAKTLEDLCMVDDKLMNKFLETEDLSQEDIIFALKKGFSTGQLIPTLCGAAAKNIGVDILLDVLTTALDAEYMKKECAGADAKGQPAARPRDPSAPFSARVFKTFVDHFSGVVSVMKICSGTVNQNDEIYNASTQNRDKVTKLFKVQGKEYVEIQQAGAGDVVAVPKLKDTRTGHTLCIEKQPIVYPNFLIPSPVLVYSLVPASQKDEARMLSSLEKVGMEDVALHIWRDAENAELRLGAQGQSQIDITIEALRRKFQIEVKLETPKIHFRETITKKTSAQGKYKKQTGGHGQYGDAWLEFEPLPRGKGFVFENKVVGGSIPKQYIPAVEKGLTEALGKGFVKGYPVIDMRAAVTDGSYHDVDSSEFAFKMAASLGFKKAMESAGPIMLEPVMTLELMVPDEYTGDVMGDLNSRRGRILSMDTQGGIQIIKAQVPHAELLNYAPILQSITQGKATFSFQFSHYDPVPQQSYKDIPSKLRGEESDDEKEKKK